MGMLCWSCNGWIRTTRVYYIALMYAGTKPCCGECKRDWAKGYHVERVQRINQRRGR